MRAFAALTIMLAASCQSEGPHPLTAAASSPLATQSLQAAATGQTLGAGDALRAVFASESGGFAISSTFPSAAGVSVCQIHGGGPPPGIVVPGTCRTELSATGSGFIVTFTETWDARQFHLATEPATGELHHTWSFTVDRAGEVVLTEQSGNFPPQFVL